MDCYRIPENLKVFVGLQSEIRSIAPPPPPLQKKKKNKKDGEKKKKFTKKKLK